MTHRQVRDVSLFVEVFGQGDPLLLLHGGPGLDHTTLLSLRPLADRHTLVFYDQRCNGRSAGPAVSTMTWENLTADAEALRRQLGFERWAVLGHSFGGQVALEYALRYPASLSRLVLMGTGGDQWWVRDNAPELLARRGYRPGAVQAARRFYRGELAPADFYRTLLQFASAYNYRNNLLAMARELLFGPKLVAQPEALIFGYSHLLPGWSVMERLGEVRMPTLVLAGRHDFLFPPEHQAILADRLPDARLQIVERAGHSPHAEQPAETLAAIRSFLAPAAQTRTPVSITKTANAQ